MRPLGSVDLWFFPSCGSGNKQYGGTGGRQTGPRNGLGQGY